MEWIERATLKKKKKSATYESLETYLPVEFFFLFAFNYFVGNLWPWMILISGFFSTYPCTLVPCGKLVICLPFAELHTINDQLYMLFFSNLFDVFHVNGWFLIIDHATRLLDLIFWHCSSHFAGSHSHTGIVQLTFSTRNNSSVNMTQENRLLYSPITTR